jgi:hypothetical protein
MIYPGEGEPSDRNGENDPIESDVCIQPILFFRFKIKKFRSNELIRTHLIRFGICRRNKKKKETRI